jgi:polyhydroxyalkanoate synthesis repressor PhaR
MERRAVDTERLIRRYDNRKLYDPAARRYVTLDDVAASVAAGEDVRIVDQKTGEDLTNVVLAQVLLDRLKDRTAVVPRQVLVRLIRLTAQPGTAWSEWNGPQDAAQRARQEAERIVAGLLSRGRLSLDEALALRQEITSSVHGIVTDAQGALERRVRGLLDRSEKDGERDGVAVSLGTLRERLLSFESFLEPRPAEGRAPSEDAGHPRRERNPQPKKRRKS